MKNFLSVVSLDEAKKIMKENFDLKLCEEEISLEDSLGRTLAQNIISQINIPSFDRSSVDGYAIRAEDSYSANENTPTLLKVMGSVEMGKNSELSIKNGEAIYIPTGGMLPKNSSGVIMIEDTENFGDEILVNKSIAPMSNIISMGSEIKKSDEVLQRDTKINSAHIALMASLGLKKIKVYEQIKFYIISSGDEVKNLGENLSDGEVYDVNSFALESIIKENFGKIEGKVLVKDDLNFLEQEIKKGLETSHVILISGGSSAGVRDFTKESIEKNNGEILVHGISIKPGKPTIIAKYLDKKNMDKIILGLPGHPQSAIRVFKELMFQDKKKFFLAKCAENISGEAGKTLFINVKLEYFEDYIKAVPVYTKSGMIRPLVESDGYILVTPEREGIYKDEFVKVWLNN
ncbi:MAG: molybdopterin molybdotransferase MoeA [Fusobacteriaceae bacterium]